MSVLWLLGLLACTDGEKGTCIDRYGVGLADDPTAAEVQQACESGGGTGCNAALFLREATARCLAEQDGLAEGVEPWVMWLGYHAERRRPAWTVSNTLGENGGELRLIDAETGEVLDRLTWQ